MSTETVPMTYVLTDTDRAIVEATVGKVGVEARQNIVDIHERHLRSNRKKRAALLAELHMVDRAILLREAALERLYLPHGG